MMQTSEINIKQSLHMRIVLLFSILSGDLARPEMYKHMYFQALGKPLPTTREELYKVLVDALDFYETLTTRSHPISELLHEGDVLASSATPFTT